MKTIFEHGGARVKGASLTEEQFRAVERGVESALRHFVSRGARAEADDMRQEGWMAALAALPRHDPARGRPLWSYSGMVARRRIAELVGRWMSAVSLSRGAIARGVAKTTCGRAEVDAEAPCPSAGPLAVVEAGETARIRAEVRGVRTAVLRRAARELPGGEREVALLLLRRTEAGLPAAGLERRAQRQGAVSKKAAARAVERLARAMDDAVEEEFTRAELEAAREETTW